jgi:two-component system, OmpR family, sensor histidine kinase TctE
MPEVFAGRSIRRQLLVFLISCLLFMLAATATVSYFVALKSANDAYDRSLLDPAIDIAQNTRVEDGKAKVDLPQQALQALVFDQVDRVVFQVRSPDNVVIDGTSDLPPPPPVLPGEHTFYTGMFAGEPMRLAVVHTKSGFLVQVGETLHKRNRLIGEILLAELMPTLIVALVAVVLTWFGVRRGLHPLELVRTELLRRSPRDLSPLASIPAASEITPVVDGFNRVLGQLREATSMQQRFLANAAHQLRTPLAGLQMHLELLLRRNLSADVRAELERMHSATTRASRLAKQLLALAKAESTPHQMQPFDVIDLADIAAAAARDWAPRAVEKNIDLGYSLDNAIVMGDPLLLPELLDNLIDNALRYTPVGGTVTVTTGHQDEAPYLAVEDTGPGVPPEEKDKVIERFYRVAGTSGEGSGLGLAIVKEVADRHGATLEIRPRGDNRTFRVRILFPKTAKTQTVHA